jgi:hypothetical protein
MLIERSQAFLPAAADLRARCQFNGSIITPVKMTLTPGNPRLLKSADTHLAAIRPHSEPARINSCDGSDDKHKPSNGYDVYPLYPYSDARNAKGYFTISTLAEVALLLNSVVQAHINTRIIKGVSCKITCIFDTIMPLH